MAITKTDTLALMCFFLGIALAARPHSRQYSGLINYSGAYPGADTVFAAELAQSGYKSVHFICSAGGADATHVETPVNYSSIPRRTYPAPSGLMLTTQVDSAAILELRAMVDAHMREFLGEQVDNMLIVDLELEWFHVLEGFINEVDAKVLRTQVLFSGASSNIPDPIWQSSAALTGGMEYKGFRVRNTMQGIMADSVYVAAPNIQEKVPATILTGMKTKLLAGELPVVENLAKPPHSPDYTGRENFLQELAAGGQPVLGGDYGSMPEGTSRSDWLQRREADEGRQVFPFWSGAATAAGAWALRVFYDEADPGPIWAGAYEEGVDFAKKFQFCGNSDRLEGAQGWYTIQVSKGPTGALLYEATAATAAPDLPTTSIAAIGMGAPPGTANIIITAKKTAYRLPFLH